MSTERCRCGVGGMPFHGDHDCPSFDTVHLDPELHETLGYKPMQELHVTPVNDDVEHDEDQDCICGPNVEVVSNGVIVVHHSLDGREKNENAE